MYDRLTIEDKLSHKEAASKIYEDHKHLQGFSPRNIRRSLMSLDNPNVPRRRSRKIGPTWPNSVDPGGPIDIGDRQNTELPYKSSVTEHKQDLEKGLTRKTECTSCNELVLQIQKLEKEKSKVTQGHEQALQIIKKQISEIQDAKFHNNQTVTSNDSVRGLEQEIALLYDPLWQAMASTFKLKENKLWLTIKFGKNSENIIAVYAGRKSSVAYSSQSILSSHG